MRNLVDGIHRFQNLVFEEHKLLFEKLSEGQAPSTLFITCSDSRIVPNLFTQTGPGELFTLRNAGNIVPPYGASNGGESPTIEYAVAVLGVQHIVVCGHSGCGAISALLNPASVARMPAIAAWFTQAEATRRIIDENYAHLAGESRMNVAVAENVLVQIENLETHPCVRAKLVRNKLTIHGWVYKIESGQVFAYSTDRQRFLPLSDDSPRNGFAPQPAAAGDQRPPTADGRENDPSPKGASS